MIPANRAAAALAACLALAGGATLARAADVPKAVRACVACHTFTKGGESKIGPNLFGIYGKPAAAVPGFDRYGEAMKAAAAKGLTWTAENLEAYVDNPVAFLKAASGDPDTRTNMIARIRKPADRAAIVAYLKSLKD
ncbi:c-type cytochrome [Oleispirillum naphthae]|uniref:c-type cytochrome n=1 Tax=Oleispirillum naphthae TaxID=2838853 RepID=UPI003082474E